EARKGDKEHQDPRRRPAHCEIACNVTEVLEDRERTAKLRSAAADTDLEAVREDGVAPPEGDREHRHCDERRQRLAESARAENVEALRTEYERAVRVDGDARENGEPPQDPPGSIAAVERAQEREVRQRRGEEEDRVHPAVDAVEEEHPARRDDRR